MCSFLSLPLSLLPPSLLHLLSVSDSSKPLDIVYSPANACFLVFADVRIDQRVERQWFVFAKEANLGESEIVLREGRNHSMELSHRSSCRRVYWHVLRLEG